MAIQRTFDLEPHSLLSDLLLIVQSKDGTDNTVSFTLKGPLKNLLANMTLNDKDQHDTKTGVTNLYLFTIKQNLRFAAQAHDKGSLCISIEKDGMDLWEPTVFHLFGVWLLPNGDAHIVPIFNEAEWSRGGLTRDESKGESEIHCPLVIAASPMGSLGPNQL